MNPEVRSAGLGQPTKFYDAYNVSKCKIFIQTYQVSHVLDEFFNDVNRVVGVSETKLHVLAFAGLGH